MRQFLYNNKFLVMLWLISILGLFIFVGHYSEILIDFGREVYYPEQILNGKVLFKDLFVIYGPLSYQINAIFYKLLGTNLNTLYILGGLISIGIVSGVYLIANKFFSKFLSFCIGLFTCFVGIFTTSIFNFHFPYSWAVTYGLTAFLYSLYFLIKFSENKKSKDLYISSLLAGISIIFKYDFLLYVIIILFYIIKNKNYKALTALISVPLISLSTLVFQGMNFSDISNTLGIIKNMSQSLTLKYFYQNSGVYFHPKVFLTNLILLIKFALPFGCFLYSVNLFNKKKNISIILILFSIISVIFLFNYKYAFGFLPIFLLVFGIASYKKFNEKIFILTVSTLLVCAKVFWVLLLSSYGSYYISILIIAALAILFRYLPVNFEKITGWFLILISILILYNNSISFNNTNNKIQTPKGTICTEYNKSESSTKLIEYINENTLLTDKIVIFPEGLTINFLTNRESDDFYNSLLPLYVETFGEDDILKHFSQNAPNYIILNNLDMKDYYFRFICQDYGQEICSFISNNYEHIETIGENFRYLIFRRISR